MSDYNRKFWKNSPETPITAEDLNNIEEGVENLYKNISNPNLFINGNFQIWSNGESFQVQNKDTEVVTPVLTADKWYVESIDSTEVLNVNKFNDGLYISSSTPQECAIYQLLDDETYNAIKNKTLTLSYEYTQPYSAEDTSVHYETHKEVKQIVAEETLAWEFVNNNAIRLPVGTVGGAGCTLHWVKLEVGELDTPCIPDSKDALICKLEQEIDDLNDKLTNKTTWKFLGEATNGNKLTLPNPDDYEDLLIVVSSSDADTNCKYTFSLCKYLIENFYTGAFEYLKQGSYANEYYYTETIVEFSNSKNGNYVKLNSVNYQGNNIGGSIHVCYR